MITLVDFGSQTAHLIGRRLRDHGVLVKIVDPEDAVKFIMDSRLRGNDDEVAGIILSGGPASVYSKGAPTIDKKIFSLGIPILGICYGWQLTARLLGGKVVSGHKEYGPANLIIINEGGILSGVENNSVVWVSHGDSVVIIPKGFTYLGETDSVKAAAVADLRNKIFGVQFHPEVMHTVFGLKILINFAQNICGEKIVKQSINVNAIIENIEQKVGNNKVICAVSGGVDSTVAAALIGQAIGKNLYPIYIESGLMRIGTKEEVLQIFQKHLRLNPIIVDAKKQFLSALKDITDPEQKRKTIGALYIKLFEREAKKLKGVKFLAQGTIYSDVIESRGTKKADKIKSHHNVGGLPDEMSLVLLEPLRNFYKDEVRLIGEKLGLPNEVVSKQVFPGPGQAIRIIGEVTKERLERQQQADAIVVEEVTKANLYDKVYMSFAILTDTKSTAVKGDERSHLEVMAIRIIESKDVMTTVWSKIPYEILQKISSRIVNEVPGVSRVVYDITTKPPATMEWE
ncbi:MAG: glutamine-hydrolyzing GMP synthase [Candidatus Daviesbacteria bacterium]|nr:glutamine-hydrolyzing GMP synthase [Candidatus Daviesbacteria bacterium]